jgi:flavin reductase (DIM6/NTAB) family NADH-FMN oxidoreductase RutF
MTKRDYPLAETRRYLETGPIVLVSSAWQGKCDIMTLGWHMMLQFTPARLATYIWDGNNSHAMIRASRECVINLPTLAMLDTVVAIGNSSGAETDKFAAFGLTAQPGSEVSAPMIAECVANFECVLADDSQVDRHGLFIWEVRRAHVAQGPERLETLHYRGDGLFMVAGRTVSRRGRFLPQNL